MTTHVLDGRCTCKPAVDLSDTTAFCTRHKHFLLCIVRHEAVVFAHAEYYLASRDKSCVNENTF